MNSWLLIGLCLFGLLLASGQVLFKLAGRDTAVIRQWSDLPGLFGSHWLWVALIVYGIATLLWVVLLQRVPLSKAYPFAALGFVLVPAAAWWLFGERITPHYLVGAALIVTGIITISFSD
jgi:drug/metabolite transporter (DMT)-like permease